MVRRFLGPYYYYSAAKTRVRRDFAAGLGNGQMERALSPSSSFPSSFFLQTQPKMQKSFSSNTSSRRLHRVHFSSPVLFKLHPLITSVHPHCNIPWIWVLLSSPFILQTEPFLRLYANTTMRLLFIPPWIKHIAQDRIKIK